MKKYMVYSLVLLTSVFATSCEKVIDINVNDEIGRLVMEGIITDTTSQQEIKLSRNIAFSEVNNYPAVSGAIVIVRDDQKNEYLFQETTAGTYVAKEFTGITGRQYTMEVGIDENKYVAQSRMPEAVVLDSIAAEKPELGDKDTRNIKVFYKDPKDQRNQYRFILFVNDRQMKDIYAMNDDFNNGNQVSLTLRHHDVDIFAGDKIRVEMLCIDQPVYHYWYSLMQQSSGGGVTPSDPPTNITPTALGYFSAHTASSKTIQVD